MGKLPKLIIGHGTSGVNIEDQGKTIRISDNDVNCVNIPSEAIGPMLEWLQTKEESKQPKLSMILTENNGFRQYVIAPPDVMAYAQHMAQKYLQLDLESEKNKDEFYCATGLNLEVANLAQKFDMDPETLYIIIMDLKSKLQKEKP